jgi:hypothetical protein
VTTTKRVDTIEVVVTDANVLINLIITERLGLLHELPGLRFCVTREVVEEKEPPRNRRLLPRRCSPKPRRD